MPSLSVRDVSLFVEVVGHGYPLLLMHGGPGADHWTLLPFKRCADRFTLVFYDHRCNGRSSGAPVSSMTWENLTADADALRERLGFERWAVLGHSFGGKVALEYSLRYPDSLSHLVLLDTGGDSRWAQEYAPELLARRGFSPTTVKLARRFLNGQIAPREFLPTLLRLGKAYNPYMSPRQMAADLIHGEWRTKMRPEALIYAAPNLLKGWTVMDRLGEITVPTLVMAGRDDFLFPPEHQEQLAAGIPNARLRIIERAGHNPHSERPAEVMAAVREFVRTEAPVLTGAGTGRAMAHDVYVHESGTLGDPAIVFVHGGGPSGRMWRFHMDRLAGRFHCLAPDLPGFGRSNQLGSLSLAETADLVADLIDTRVPTRHAHVVGLSYGGSVVIATLGRHPGRIDRAIVDGAAVLPTWGGWGDRLVQLGATALSPLINSRPLVALLGCIGLREVGVELGAASPRAFRRAYREGFTAPVSGALLRAPCPTLLVAGGREGTVRASDAALAALMPNATARFVPGLGHAWFRLRRELHVRMIEAWLSREALPDELEPEPPSPAAVDRVLRRLEIEEPGASDRAGRRPR